MVQSYVTSHCKLASNATSEVGIFVTDVNDDGFTALNAKNFVQRVDPVYLACSEKLHPQLSRMRPP